MFGRLNFWPRGHKRAFWKCTAPDISGAAVEGREQGGDGGAGRWEAKKISYLIRKGERAGFFRHKRFIH